jgi:hypothetical protein
MKEKYSEYIKFFLQKEKPMKILSDNIINEYSNTSKELPKIYKDVWKEYSQINILTINQDTISMIYWDMAFLSDEFICYCLPVLIPKALEYEDTVLLNQLKKMNFEKLTESDTHKIQQLINTMESDKRFMVTVKTSTSGQAEKG